MTYAARAATSPELALYRTPGKRTKLRAAIFTPTVIYQARINQSFATRDGVLEITYDTGSGTLADVLPDMEMYVGTTSGGHEKGICRVRSIDATKVYIGETSDITFADNDYLTIIDSFSLWARHVRISAGVPFMDGGTAYSDQHTNFDPVPLMGSHRVLKLTGASVSASFSAAGSYALDSSISAYVWSCATASGSSGTTTATPTFQFNAVGWHLVYLTLTAANGKTFFGVRYVYVWSEASPPSRARIENCREEAEGGGWSFDLTMLDDCDLTLVRDHALVILFGEDYYGSTQSNIGPLAGCENIYVVGWINSRVSINWNPEQGSVAFNVQGAQHFFRRIPSYPDGVELVSRPAAAWTEIRGLTVNKGLFHFLRWRTTATRIMDVQLTDNTFYTREVASLAQNLWEQLREMAFLQVFARAGVNALGQLYIEVHPQLVPEADRNWPTVMTIAKGDWIGEINFERVAGNECSQVNLKGVSVNENGKGTPYFSLSTGHTYSHYGAPDIQDSLLVSSQAQANSLAGLYFGWRNNPYPDIPIVFKAPVRLIDCFPRQQCEISIAAGDTPRGITYSGALIPKSVALVQDENGYVHSEVNFEAETFEALSVNGDVPESGNVSIPPTPKLPPLPPIEILVPGTTVPTEDGGPPKVLVRDGSVGLGYTENFHESSPDWQTVNAGLTSDQYIGINEIILTPSGEIYVAHRRSSGFGAQTPYIAYAPSIGATFTIIEDQTSILAKLSHSSSAWGVNAIGVNPLTGQVAYVIATDTESALFIGSGSTFAQGADLTARNSIGAVGNLSFGHNEWRLTSATSVATFTAISADGASITRSVNFGLDGQQQHIPISTSDIILGKNGASLIRVTQNGAVAGDFTTPVGSSVLSDDHWDNRIAVDPSGMYLMLPWDTGQRGRSSDGGATIVGIPNLPFGGVYAYDYAGGVGVESRWVAARGIIRYSPDFGETWENKEGNIFGIAPTPAISIVKVVEI